MIVASNLTLGSLGGDVGRIVGVSDVGHRDIQRIDDPGRVQRRLAPQAICRASQPTSRCTTP